MVKIGLCYPHFQNEICHLPTKNLSNKTWVLNFRTAEMFAKDREKYRNKFFCVFFEAYKRK